MDYLKQQDNLDNGNTIQLEDVGKILLKEATNEDFTIPIRSMEERFKTPVKSYVGPPERFQGHKRGNCSIIKADETNEL